MTLRACPGTADNTRRGAQEATRRPTWSPSASSPTPFAPEVNNVTNKALDPRLRHQHRPRQRLGRHQDGSTAAPSHGAAIKLNTNNATPNNGGYGGIA